MKITVLGCYGPYPPKGGACSSYLLESNNKKILLDVGNGSLSNLQNICNLEEIDLIILSHLHPDHISDLFVLRYAFEELNKKVTLLATNSNKDIFASLIYKDVFNVIEINEDLIYRIDNITFTFNITCHPILNHAIKASDGLKTFVYSGDASYLEKIEKFCCNANLALIDSCVPNSNKEKLKIHMSAYEAALLATNANVKKLILTHFSPNRDITSYLEEVKDFKNINIDYADTLKSFEV